MVDRQDIDALLVGALYGELTPADESRLAAHLESHPADRAALENMTRAREAVRESRVLADQHEPPQSVSALLLQEAARRAPKPAKEAKPSWFERLARSFMAHPAMAAAAMLVVVVGVAGTMYLTRGDQYVDSKASEARHAETEKAAPTTTVAPASPVGAAQGAAADNPPDLALAERTREVQPAAPSASPSAGKGKDTDSYDVTLRDRGTSEDAKAEAKEVPAHKAAVAKPAPARVAPADSRSRGTGGVMVTTPQPRPQELKAKLDDSESVGGASNGEIAQQRRAPANDVAKKDAPPPAPAVATAPPRPEPQPAQSPAPPPPPKSPPADKNVANGPPTGNRTNDQQLAAAAAMHAEAKRLAKTDCRAAARQVNAIAAQYPDYYNAKVVNDRDLKACTAYIDAARNNENEKQQKSRAQKRPADMEAPASAK